MIVSDWVGLIRELYLAWYMDTPTYHSYSSRKTLSLDGMRKTMWSHSLASDVFLRMCTRAVATVWEQ